MSGTTNSKKPVGLAKDDEDVRVQSTNDEATIARASCATAGHLPNDIWSVLFVNKKHARRNEPLHNLGTFYRVAHVRKAIELFLMTGDEEADEDDDDDDDGEDGKQRTDDEKEKKVKYAKQVINLGSGYDTSWWCLVGSKKSFTNRVKWYDVDFAEVIRRKIKTIEKHEALREPLGVYHFERDGSELRSTSGYNLVSADLRDAEELKEMLTEARVDWNLPTLFVTEVALSYLNREKCEKVLRLCATFNGDKSSDRVSIKLAANRAIVSYEAMRLNDEFGRRMCKNVREQRGTPFLALEEENGSHIDCASVEAMLVKCGFDAVKCRKMSDCQDVLLSREEIYRAERLEMLDEREEFNLIQSHYGVSIGVRGDYFARTFRRWLLS